MKKFISSAFTSLFFIFPLLASGQSYPSKPVRLIIAFPTGGGTDLVGRVLAQRFATQTGQQMIPDNRTGAGGNVAAEIVARLPADGYSLLLTTNSITVNATLYPKLKYDLLKDFAPVSLLAEVPLVLAIHPSVPVRSVKELIAFGRKNKGKLSFGSNGSGTTSHLSGVLLNMEGGLQATHVPYRGGGPLTTALMSGEVDMGFAVSLAVKPFVQSGRLRALAVSTLKPSPSMPNVPTMASVIPGFETNVWHGLFAPTGTPSTSLNTLHREMIRALKAPEVIAALESGGAEAVGTSPTEFAKIVRDEIKRYAKLVQESGAKAE